MFSQRLLGTYCIPGSHVQKAAVSVHTCEYGQFVEYLIELSVPRLCNLSLLVCMLNRYSLPRGHLWNIKLILVWTFKKSYVTLFYNAFQCPGAAILPPGGGLRGELGGGGGTGIINSVHLRYSVLAIDRAVSTI